MIRKLVFMFFLLSFSFIVFGKNSNDDLYKIESKLILVKQFSGSIDSEVCNKILNAAIDGQTKYINSIIQLAKHSPHVKVNLGQKSDMIVTSNAQYFEPISNNKNSYKLCTLTSNDAPGMNLSLELNETGDYLNLDYRLKLRFINDREKLKQVILDVGKPNITSVSSEGNKTIKLDKWMLISQKKLELVDDKNAIMLIAVRVNRLSSDKLKDN